MVNPSNSEYNERNCEQIKSESTNKMRLIFIILFTYLTGVSAAQAKWEDCFADVTEDFENYEATFKACKEELTSYTSKEIFPYWESPFSTINPTKSQIKKYMKGVRENKAKINTQLGNLQSIRKDGYKMLAINYFDAAIKDDPKYQLAYLKRGLFYAQRRLQYSKAILDFTTYISFEPQDPKAYFYRGVASSKINNHDKAIEDYNFALNLSPDIPGLYVVRGHSFLKKDNYDKALEDLEHAISLDSNLIYAHSTRAKIYAKKGDYDKALEDYNTEIKLYPKSYEAYEARGKFHAERDKYNLAIKDFDMVLLLTEDNYDLDVLEFNRFAKKAKKSAQEKLDQ